MPDYRQPLVHETFLRDASELLLKKCLLGNTWTVMLSAGLNLQSHNGVLPVRKGLIFYHVATYC